MNKPEKIKLLAQRMAEVEGREVSDAEAKRWYDQVHGLVKENLVNEGVAVIEGVGELKKVARAARKGRNPKTKEELDIPARMSATLKISGPFDKELKEMPVVFPEVKKTEPINENQEA